MVFPVVMYGCESWTVKKAEHRRMDAFELWCWRRLLRVPWTARRSNQSILKEISPGCSLEGLMLKLKIQIFGHLRWRADSFEKTLMAGKDWRQEEKGTTEDEMAGWHHRIDAYEFGWTPGVGDRQRGLACCRSWGRKESDTTEQLDWTKLNWVLDWDPVWLRLLIRMLLSVDGCSSHSGAPALTFSEAQGAQMPLWGSHLCFLLLQLFRYKITISRKKCVNVYEWHYLSE